MVESSGYFGVCLVFLVLVAPMYLLFRFLVKLVRAYYGFADDADDGPPLRICQSCHNTVMEEEFRVCPYCGQPLPRPVAGGIGDAGAGWRDVDSHSDIGAASARRDAASSDAAPPDAAPPGAAQSDAAPPGAAPGNAASSDAAPNDAAPRDGREAWSEPGIDG